MEKVKPLCNLEERTENNINNVKQFDHICPYPNRSCYYARIIDGVKGIFCNYENSKEKINK